ncbi:MAG TPA: chemotaxis-specific protein-glutamate methyltransferase CheB [Gammaproteobacteria bacterium]|nr:chemotaxis-specific protein-glutamate methyltransferase CheB [Gammaproteobacteria bacterium]
MIKILIVDDSAVETRLFKHFLESQPDMCVVAFAKDGAEAIEMARRHSPDLITMDLEMPVMDGHTATRLIMAQCPAPIVVISSKLNETSKDMTYLALEAGAVSVLAKPVNNSPDALEAFGSQLIDTVRSMAEIKVIKRRFDKPLSSKKTSVFPGVIHTPGSFEIIGMGASIGGPEVLKKIISHLPPTFPVPIVIVQHMTAGFMSGFTRWLDIDSPLTVKNVEHGEVLKKGVIYFAPDHVHFTVERTQKGLTAKLVEGNPVSGFCPSITVLLQSIAETSKNKGLGILLTGMGSDGAEGLLALKKEGGHTLVQDKKSCVVFGMGNVAQSMGAVNEVVPLHQIAQYLIKMTHQKQDKASLASRSQRLPKEQGRSK